MKRKARIASAIAIAVLVGLSLRVVLAFERFSRVEGSFASIRIGDSRQSVVATLGKPNYHAGGCGVIHVPLKNCALEYVYSHPFAPLLPDYYVVSFSTDDRVIEAERWTSP
jgi:hypothetical protein